MAPPRRQSAASSRSVSLSDAETSSDASLSTSQSSISATSTTISSPVEESLSASLLPSESSTSILDEDIGKSSLNGTDTTDVPVPSEEYGIAPISTDEPFSEVNRTFLAHDSYSGPVLNGTDVNDMNSTSTSEESFSGNAISKDTSTSSQLTTSIFSRIPAPSQASETPNRITNEGAPNSSNDDLNSLDTAPLLFASATTFTSAGTVYVQSIFPTSIETTLPNGDVVTTAKGFTTVVAVPTAQTNVNDDGSRIQDPSGPPGPIPVLNPSSESFFQRPAAATGVFVVVLLVIGSVIWMCLIIRRHRRQVVAAANEHKRPGYMYGSTGISPRDRRSHMSYDSRNWPERFDQHEIDNVASTSAPAPVPSTTNPPLGPQIQASNVPNETDPEDPQMGAVIPRAGSTLPMDHPIIRSHSQRQPSIFRTTSPPISARFPIRTWSSPTRTSLVVPADENLRGSSYHNPVGFGTNQQIFDPSSGLMAAPRLLPLSRTASTGRQRANSATSLNPYSYPKAGSSVVPSLVSDAGPSSQSLLGRRTSDTPSQASSENPFRSSAYIVPSPTPSAELRGMTERLSNPFEDAESPPHSPIAFTYVREGDQTQAVMLERGVSLRRNDSMKNRPMHTSEAHATLEASTVEWGTSGSSAASSSVHVNMTAPLRIATRYTLERKVPRKSESISTAESSVVTPAPRIGSLDEGELFYNPAFAVASPVRTDNPGFPERMR